VLAALAFICSPAGELGRYTDKLATGDNPENVMSPEFRSDPRAYAHALTPIVLRAVIVATVALTVSRTDLFGQTPSIPDGRNEASIVAAAEAEGAGFPRHTESRTNSYPRSCAIGYDLGPARSGEFSIGGNLGGVPASNRGLAELITQPGSAAMRAGHVGKVWWAPDHQSRDMPPLVVRGRSLSNSRDTVRYSSTNIAWPVQPGAKPLPESARKYFFPSGITIPAPGRWLLVATSGDNWGCFILTVL
jgi:hypothetical protein